MSLSVFFLPPPPLADTFGYRTIGVRFLMSVLALPHSHSHTHSHEGEGSPRAHSDLAPYVEFAVAASEQQQRPAGEDGDTHISPRTHALRAQLAADVWACVDVDCLYGAGGGVAGLAHFPSSLLCARLVDVLCAPQPDSELCRGLCGNPPLVRFVCAHASLAHTRALCVCARQPGEKLRFVSGVNPPSSLCSALTDASEWSDKEQMVLWVLAAAELRSAGADATAAVVKAAANWAVTAPLDRSQVTVLREGGGGGRV